MAVDGDQSFTANSNINFFVKSSSNGTLEPTFTVSGDQVIVKGDLFISGSIDTSNVYSTFVNQESLKVSDKEIILANQGSNFSAADGPFDGVPNDGAGIRIDGVPTSYDSNIESAYDKSFIWNHNVGNGVLDLGTTAGFSNEAFWELKGGSFRLTHQKIIASGGSNIVRDISFGLRVNDQDELEFVKKYWLVASNDYVVRRVARFGRIFD
jgi:hypothetical protein